MNTQNVHSTLALLGALTLIAACAPAKQQTEITEPAPSCVAVLPVEAANQSLTAGAATLDDVLRHIDHIAQMGGIGVLGMGSDFDGIDSWPEGLGNPTDFPALMELLSNHGYTNSDLEAISHGNFFRLLKKAEARAKYPKN